MTNNRKGFTLIELLVVVSIIGLLSTLSVIALNNARAKARDARRVSDIKQIQTALELYFNDNNAYPATVVSGSAIASGGVTYMGVVPTNPTPNGATYTYSSADPHSTYQIDYTLEGTVGGITGAASATPNGLGQ